MLGKTRNKEQSKLQTSRTKILLNRTNSHIFKPYVAHQALANIHEIFQNIYHLDLFYILHRGFSSFPCTAYTCLVSQMRHGNILCHLNIQKQPPEVFCKKKVFLEISQNSQENICARAFFGCLVHSVAVATNHCKSWTVFIAWCVIFKFTT